MAKKTALKVPESKINEILEILDSGEANGNVEKTLAFFHDMPEEERRQYAKPIQQFCKERQNMRSGLSVRNLSDTNIEEIQQMIQNSGKAFQHWQTIAKALWRALLATSLPKEIEKCKRQFGRFPLFQPGHTENSIYEVLNNRKPDWLGPFLLAEFDSSSNRAEIWDKYRTFYRQGAVDRLLSPSAICGLYTYYNWHNEGTRDKPVRPTPDYFRNDPELLDHEIWLLFELSLPELRFWSPPGQGNRWNEALLVLTEEGRLDRPRLLDAILDGIGRNHPEWQEKWLIELHDDFKPTEEERLERAEKYTAILHSPRFTTAHFALAILSSFLKRKHLDENSLTQILDAIPSLLLDTGKARVKKVLAFLDTTLKNHETLRDNIYPILLEALRHEQKDIQETGAQLLAKNYDLNDVKYSEPLTKIIPSLHSSARVVFPTPSEIPTSSTSKTNEIETSIPAGLSKQFLHLASVEEVRQSLECGSGIIPPTKFNGMDVPRLKPDEYLHPPKDAEDLCELIVATVSRPMAAPLFEWMVDGIARMPDIDDDIRRRLAPIRETLRLFERGWPWLSIVRCCLGTKSEVHGIPCFIDEDGYQLCALPKEHLDRSLDNSALLFWTSWLDGIIQHLLRFGAYQPLGTPTHLGHWIDPMIFVERIIENRATLHQYDIFDKILGLLRLAPDHRDEGLKILDGAGIKDDAYVESVRYALGADDVEMKPILPEWSAAPIWAAASRSRHPFEEDPFVQNTFSELGFGTTRPVRYEKMLELEIDWKNGRFGTNQYRPVLSEAFAPNKNQQLYPMIQLYRQWPVYRCYSFLWDMWPGSRNACHLDGLTYLAGTMNKNTASESGMQCQILEELIQPDLPLTPEATILLSLGLVCASPTTSMLAVDIAIAAIHDGRFDENVFVNSMLEQLPFAEKQEIPLEYQERNFRFSHEHVEELRLVPSRWGKNFRTISSESPLHAQYIRRIVERVVPALPGKDSGVFLDLLLEQCIESGEVIEQAETREFLAGMKGSGKAAKTAKQLLDLLSNESLRKERRRLAAQQALQGRIERVKRWMAVSPEE